MQKNKVLKNLKICLKEEQLNILIRYDSKHEVKKICKKILKLGIKKNAEKQNISKNKLNQIKKFQKNKK